MSGNFGSLKKNKILSTPRTSHSTINLKSESSERNKLPVKSNTKEVTQDDLDYAYNMYLLAHATTKRQESMLAQITAQNEDKRLMIMEEIEKKHSFLASLVELESEIKNLSEETHVLKNQKKVLGDCMDELTVKLKNVDMLKTSLQTDLPVMGFKPGSDTSKLKDVLDKMKRNLDLLQTRDLQEFSEIVEAVEKIEKQISGLKGTQKRSDAACAELKAAAIKEACLKHLQNTK